ncbi:MAG TPA: histidine kinase [Cytophagaceae bacterium]
MTNLKIFHKLGLSHFLLGFFTLLLLSYTFYKSFEKAIIERTTSHVNSINVLKKTEIINYLQQRKANFELFRKNSLVPYSAKFFINNRYRAEAEATSNYHNDLKELGKDFGYKNILLFDTSFNLLFAADTLAESYTEKNDKALLSQLSRLNASENYLIYKTMNQKGEGMLLIGGKVTLKGDNMGIVVAQKKMSYVMDILRERTGMGSTGESYIAGKNYFMQSTSRFYPDSIPNKIMVKTLATENALNGKEGFGIIDDYRGEPVISAYRNIKIDGVEWAIMSEIDMDEAMSPVYVVRKKLVWISLLILFFIALATYILSSKISSSILYLKEIILSLASGKLPEKPIVVRSRDEIGEMTEAVNDLSESFKHTAIFAQQIGKGDFSAHHKPLSPEDNLGLALIDMREQLKVLKDKEEQLSRERASGLMEGQENERKRISRELHDGIAQMLTAAKFKIGSLQVDHKEYGELKKLVDETISEVRRLSYNLMPSVLIDFGLESALRTLCKNSEIADKLKINYTFINDAETRPNFDISLAVYRIAQEAINNIVKHSDASVASVSVIYLSDKLLMEIADNGKGIGMDHQINSTLGIRNMYERARIVNGELTIESTREDATIIRLEIYFNNGQN